MTLGWQGPGSPHPAAWQDTHSILPGCSGWLTGHPIEHWACRRPASLSSTSVQSGAIIDTCSCTGSAPLLLTPGHAGDQRHHHRHLFMYGIKSASLILGHAGDQHQHHRHARPRGLHHRGGARPARPGRRRSGPLLCGWRAGAFPLCTCGTDLASGSVLPFLRFACKRIRVGTCG